MGAEKQFPALQSDLIVPQSTDNKNNNEEKERSFTNHFK